MSKEITDLYEEYTDGNLGRREFIKKLTLLAGGTTAACALLPVLESGFAEAQIVPKKDPRLITEYIKYPGGSGDVRAYLARPKGEKKLPGVIVIHENKGLQPHIEDVARRVALEGFLAVAPDALSPLGGTSDDVNEARTQMRNLDGEITLKNFVAAVKYVKTNPLSTGMVAVNSPDLLAAAPFYGSQPAAEDVPKIKASLLLHYAGNDNRINSGIPAFETALKKASVEYKVHMYEGASHAFHNDANASRYNKKAAQLAFKRTIDFFNKKLKS